MATGLALLATVIRNDWSDLNVVVSLSIVGAAVLITLPQVLTIFHEYEHLMLGLIIIVSMIFMRRGIVPSLSGLLARKERA